MHILRLAIKTITHGYWDTNSWPDARIQSYYNQRQEELLLATITAFWDIYGEVDPFHIPEEDYQLYLKTMVALQSEL